MQKNTTPRFGKGFDSITGIYDFMACVFSFNQINKSQLVFLPYLSTQKTALLLGGGSGYFLQKLLEQNSSIQISYVEISPKMIFQSQKRIKKNCPNEFHRVTFICQAAEEFEWQKYDVIVCNYFFDLFETDYLKRIFQKIKANLNPDGFLYVTDFNIPKSNSFLKWCTHTGLKILYTFFRWTTNLQTKQLTEVEKLLKEQGGSVLHSKSFLSGVLLCLLYQQKPHSIQPN